MGIWGHALGEGGHDLWVPVLPLNVNEEDYRRFEGELGWLVGGGGGRGRRGGLGVMHLGGWGQDPRFTVLHVNEEDYICFEGEEGVGVG